MTVPPAGLRLNYTDSPTFTPPTRPLNISVQQMSCRVVYLNLWSWALGLCFRVK